MISRRAGKRSFALLPLVLAVALPAQQKPDPLRVLRTMEVEGVAAFDRDRIAGALVLDGTLLRELLRPLDPEAAASIAERVQELHRRGGYLQANANADVAAGVVTVRLEAGPRSACGAIRIEGNTVVPTARLRERLTVGAGEKPLWTEGAFPVLAMDMLSRRAIAIVTAAYRDAGRHGVRVQAELQPDGGAVSLHIAIADEGREVRVQKLAIDGDDAAAAAVLAAVPFTPGSLADTATIEALQRGIEASGRYFEVQARLPDPVPAALEPLLFAVKPRPNAPAPGTLAARDVAQVRAMFDKVLADLRVGRVLRLQTELREGDAAPQLRLLPGPAGIAFGSDGVELAAERTGWGEGTPVRASLRLCADALTVVLAERTLQWRFGEALGVQITVNTSFSASGEAELRWGIGLGTMHRDLVAASLHPATAAHLLTRARSIRRDGEELVVEFPVTTLRIGADGSVVGDRIEFVDGERRLALAWSQERLASPHGRTVESARGASPVAMVCDAVARLARAQLTATADPRVRALVVAAIESAATLPASTTPDSAAVDVPSLADGGMAMERMVAAVAGRLVVDRRFHGELVAVAGAFAAMLRGDGTAGAHFGALAENRSAGPLVLGAVAKLLGLIGNDRAATSFRAVAADRCTFEAFYRDAAGLAANLPEFASVPAHVGAAWRRVPELQALLAGLPAGGEGDVQAWQKGLELLWQYGGEQWLRDNLLGN
jgi:hypothetical protein